MNLDSILNVVFFIVGLAMGLLQLYIAQHQFEVQQREKMDELRKTLTDIQQRMAIIEEMTSNRVFDLQDKLIHLVKGDKVVAEFTEETGKLIRALIGDELKASGVHDSMQRTKSLEQNLDQILARSASALIEQTTATESTELTSRERQISDLQTQGKSSTQIAEMLGISLATLHRHLANLRRKLGDTNGAT